MKTYGLRRVEIWSEDLAVGRSCSGSQSRGRARVRAADKKLLHRRARRTVGKIVYERN